MNQGKEPKINQRARFSKSKGFTGPENSNLASQIEPPCHANGQKNRGKKKSGEKRKKNNKTRQDLAT